MQAWMKQAVIKMERNGSTMTCKHGEGTEYNFGKPRKSKAKIKAKIKAHVRWHADPATKAIIKAARKAGRDLLVPSAYARGAVTLNLGE